MKISTKKILAAGTLLSLLGVVVLVEPSLAENPLYYWNQAKPAIAGAGLPQQSAITTVLGFVRAFLSIIGIIALILIISGGFIMMTSAGNEEKVKKGRDLIIWSAIGSLVILSSLGILQLVDSFI